MSRQRLIAPQQLIACPSCDSLMQLPCLQHGESANCHVCKHPVSRYDNNSQEHVVAFALSAGIFLFLACAFPFLSLQSAGIEHATTLLQTPLALYNNGMHLLAMMVGLFILLFPLCVLLWVLLVYIPLLLSYPASWLVLAGRCIFALQAWCMVDVFLLAVIVSLVKLATMAQLQLGTGFWSYGAFSLMFTLMLSRIDKLSCWNAIEKLLFEKAEKP